MSSADTTCGAMSLRAWYCQPTRCPVLRAYGATSGASERQGSDAVRQRMGLLLTRCAMSGTGNACGAICLRSYYAVSGTDLGFPAISAVHLFFMHYYRGSVKVRDIYTSNSNTRKHNLRPVPRARVLGFHFGLCAMSGSHVRAVSSTDNEHGTICLRACYAMSGTDMA
eukprot:2133403-Rhodomonas_salina.1